MGSREEHELRKLLAATLVQKEVMEPMEKIGWGHTAPPPPDYSGQPARAEGAPTGDGKPAPDARPAGLPAQGADGKPAAAPVKADTLPPGFDFNIEDFKNPATGKYFEKYDSPAEALKGLGHLANMAKQAFRERDEFKARLEAPAPVSPTPAASPAAAPSSSSVSSASRVDVDRAKMAYDAVLLQVAEDGGILDAESVKKLSAAQSEMSRAEARFALEESRRNEQDVLDRENARWKSVNEYMSNKYPQADQFANEIGLHVSSDPLLSEAVAALVARGKEVQASELAWLSYQRTTKMLGDVASRADAEKVETDLSAREQVRNEAVERARKDAGIVTGSPGGAGVHQNPDAGGSSQAEIAALAAEMQRTGDAPGSAAAARWRHAVIGRFLDPNLFGSK